VGEGTDAERILRSIDAPSEFEPVFDRHFDAIRRYAQRRVGHDAGEEIAAEVFLIAFERRRTFDPAFDSALPWLLGITTNTIRHHLRSSRVHQAAVRRMAVPPDALEIMDANAVDALLAARRVRSVLREMPEDDRDAFLMAALGGFTYDEIARALAIPVGTVRSKIHRVRRTLRERLEAEAATTSRDAPSVGGER
jgi:RNA polymerase sigma factor (sigma-70 family)